LLFLCFYTVFFFSLSVDQTNMHVVCTFSHTNLFQGSRFFYKPLDSSFLGFTRTTENKTTMKSKKRWILDTLRVCIIRLLSRSYLMVFLFLKPQADNHESETAEATTTFTATRFLYTFSSYFKAYVQRFHCCYEEMDQNQFKELTFWYRRGTTGRSCMK
jgi:hypothetical protein